MPGSLTFTVGDGTADATMTFSGTIADGQHRPERAELQPDRQLTGAASLQIVTSDLGATGTGGTLTDNDTVAITVNVGGQHRLPRQHRLRERRRR